MGRKSTQEEFILNSIRIHGDKFDYSITQYKGVKEKVKIKCPNGHIFEQSPNDHLNGHGCKKCKGWGKYTDSNKNFIQDLKKIHKNTLDFTKTKYNGWDNQVIIICPKHGSFTKRASDLLNQKQGCPKCGRERISEKNGWDNKIFVEKSMLCHGNTYDYSKVKYEGANSKVIITCSKHGDFTQNPKDHINQSHGCPVCRNSKGENIIRKILIELDINFKPQHKFKNCINKRKLPFDFYLPEYNICIEFDGEQHFFPVESFGGVKNFNYITGNDQIKTDYCKVNNIKLLRINYKQINKINQIIKKYV